MGLGDCGYIVERTLFVDGLDEGDTAGGWWDASDEGGNIVGSHGTYAAYSLSVDKSISQAHL